MCDMTTTEAMRLLIDATGELRLPRYEHRNIDIALETIARELKLLNEPKKEENNGKD